LWADEVWQKNGLLAWLTVHANFYQLSLENFSDFPGDKHQPAHAFSRRFWIAFNHSNEFNEAKPVTCPNSVFRKIA
jgi:hypothetical protein